MIMLLELGAQVHSLQLFDRVNVCLSSGVKARRSVSPPEPHGLKVIPGQLVVEILLQSEYYKSAKCHDYDASLDRAVLGTYPSEYSCRLGSVED